MCEVLKDDGYWWMGELLYGAEKAALLEDKGLDPATKSKLLSKLEVTRLTTRELLSKDVVLLAETEDAPSILTGSLQKISFQTGQLAVKTESGIVNQPFCQISRDEAGMVSVRPLVRLITEVEHKF